jgi:hypothetical protein
MDNETPADPKDIELESLISRRIGGMGTHLHVRVKDGVVNLSGGAEDFEDKRRIETAVKGIGGVHQVINQVRVVSVSQSFDNYR